MKIRLIVLAVFTLATMSTLAGSGPPQVLHASPAHALPQLNCAAVSAPGGFTLRVITDHSGVGDPNADTLRAFICNYAVNSKDGTIAGLAVTINYDCAAATSDRWKSTTNNGQNVVHATDGQFNGYAGSFTVQEKRFALIDANTIATIFVETDRNDANALKFTTAQAQSVASALGSTYKQYFNDPACPEVNHELDLCTLLPSAPGFALDPGIGNAGSTKACKSTNNTPNRRWDTIQLTKFASPADAQTFVNATKQVDDSKYAANGPGAAYVPATGIGDAGFSYNIPAVYDANGSLLRSAGLIYAHNCYAVQGDAGYNPNNTGRSNDPAALHDVAVSIDHTLQSAPCDNNGGQADAGALTISYPVNPQACKVTPVIQIVKVPQGVSPNSIPATVKGKASGRDTTVSHSTFQLNHPWNLSIVRGVKITLPVTPGWEISIMYQGQSGSQSLTKLERARASYVVDCGGGDTLAPGAAELWQAGSAGLIDPFKDASLIKDGLGDIFKSDSGTQPFAAGSVFERLTSPSAQQAIVYFSHYQIDATDPAITKLSVYKGRVTLTPGNSSLPPVTVNAAQSVSISQNNVTQPATVAEVPGDGSQSFPQTNQASSGIFLDYWNTHGGLAQQGYPISRMIREVSDLNGQPYTVQYFERAVFEFHPEYAPPNDVLLSQLGTFQYHRKYPNGAPNQRINQTNGKFFPETNHWVGGKFWQYWQSHGGLAQQGLPLSNEFTEVSETNGKPYTVQYFERAVFEDHPEYAPPNDVLLSLLGANGYKQKYIDKGTPTKVVPAATPTRPAQPPPGNTPTSVAGNGCGNVPPPQNMTIPSGNCAKAGATFTFTGRGFRAAEKVGVYATAPDGSVIGAQFQVDADQNGVTSTVSLSTNVNSPPGIYALTMEGVTSHNKAIGYVRVLAP